jgi:hypothetical protein
VQPTLTPDLPDCRSLLLPLLLLLLPHGLSLVVVPPAADARIQAHAATRQAAKHLSSSCRLEGILGLCCCGFGKQASHATLVIGLSSTRLRTQRTAGGKEMINRTE